MIEIVNPGLLSLVVDRGRYGFGHIGVPPSSALDRYSFDAANRLMGNAPATPALEVIGKGFAFLAAAAVGCVITGARVKAHVDGKPVLSWTYFSVPPGGKLAVAGVEEGFRYYVGFSGTLALAPVMGSYATNLECRFGGFQGRPLLSGDVLRFEETRPPVEGRSGLAIPSMDPPHVLRVVEGPEMDYFTEDSLKRFFSSEASAGFLVSPRINRTGIRLEGEPLVFREGADQSIISEGLVPGTIQIPGDGLPIITLHERTIGGYARVAMIVRADRDLLAHFKPGDRVQLKLVSLEEAERLWEKRSEILELSAGPVPRS